MNTKSHRQSKSQKPALGELNKGSIQDFRPSEFMRARRPELFSDSRIVGEPRLTREVFEYHLDTLTKRKQETEFEHFCRRLAEKELCPNLIPQTGPTGGGDSKVDAETYPVADGIAMRWYEGVGREASQERWGFAFSAKEKWRSKVQDDVKGIVNTKRDYKQIYFITNQFVKDKARAEVEDALQEKYKISVRILDRNWIVKCVFENDRLRLAIETLSLTGFDESTRKAAGPHDTEREIELKELEKQIDDSARYQGVEYQLAEDCLQTALLARGLERPRVEIDGRFSRAERVANKFGHRQQRLRILYARAWTAFWWYDDFDELNRLYDQVEELASGSTRATDLELLTNLWQILHTTVMREKLDKEEAKLGLRTEKLKIELERLANEKHRPSNALHARTIRLLMDLNLATANNGTSMNSVLAGLKEVIVASEGLAEFPLGSITQIIREFGEVLADNAVYDELFEVVAGLTERRNSEGEAGKILLQRGYQKLRGGKIYDAIRLLGRAQQKLALHEYRAEWVSALAGCGYAYERAGLLWAARANMLMAANQALSEFLKHGKLVPQALRCLQRLIWLELQIGRVPSVLAWVELASIIAPQVMLDDSRNEAFRQERQIQDLVLGILLMKTDVWELKWLDSLPSVLDELELHQSWIALLYALGHEDYLRSEGVIPENESPETVRSLFIRGLEQPVNDDLPEQPEFLRGEKVLLRSFVLGCEIIVEATNTAASIYLAETILAALEAFLATGFDARILPYRSQLKIIINPADFVNGLPRFQINEDDGGQTISIRHAPTNQYQIDDPDAFHVWLRDLVLKTMFQIVLVSNPDTFAKQIVLDELGFGRALNFSNVSVVIGNILGPTPKFHLSDWAVKTVEERFELRRSLPWNHGLQLTHNKNEDDVSSIQFGEGEPPADLFGVDSMKHKDRRVFSFINVPLWDKAEWIATVYICFPDSIPILALGFKNPEAGKQIFKEWHSRFGEIDKEEQLKVSIITEINKKSPSNYKVLISTNPKIIKNSQNTYFYIATRIREMTPPDLRNLNNFLEQYNRIGRYVILPVHFISETNLPEPFWELGIEKRELSVRPAWQIGENDPDVVAITDEDDPIIPNEVKDAPVTRAMQRFAKRKNTKKR